MSAGGGSEPNLTPFIDLFSVLVCFLLMTAAWINLEVLPTNVEKATAGDAADQVVPPPPDEKKVMLVVELGATGVTLREDNRQLVVPYAGSGLNTEGLKSILSKWKTRHPLKTDVILNSEAQVQYGKLIGMYDLLVASDFPDVGISPQ